MKTLRPYTFLVLSALTILSPPDSVWAAPPEAFLSEADADGQVSGNLSDSRAGLMTLQGLTGRNELTYGALPWFGLQGNWGDNYQQQDYYTFQGFVPYNLNPGTDYFFSELGLSVTEQGRLAGDWGMGYAYYLSDWDRLLRAFGYGIVDGQYEKTRTGLGFTVENLGKYVDFRGQAFFVTSDSNDLVSRSLTGETHFTGNQLCVDGRGVRETAYHHLDYEIGGPLAYLGDYGISAYGQAYYLFNTQNEDDSVGFGIRGEWSITEDVTFNVNYSRDDVFEDATWFTVAMTTPDGAPRNFARPISVRERFSKAVVRDRRIRTNIDVEEFCLPLLNPKNGTPYNFAHVDPNRPDGTGTGTFENPFASIDMMTNNNDPFFDIIYVRPRTDGSAVNLTVMAPDGVAEATTPLMLLQNQLLLGSTIDQTIDTFPQPFIPGPTFTIPALDPGLAAPLLMQGDINPNTMVYASRGNLISGFTFDGASPGGAPRFHNGIGLDGNSILGDMILDGIGQDLHVRNNTFQNTNIGVLAPDLSDGVPSPMCSLLGNSSLWNNTFTDNNIGFDIQIDSTNDASPNDTLDGSTLTYSMLGNTIDSNATGGMVTATGPGTTVDLAARDLDGDGQTDPVLAFNTVIDNTAGGLSLGADLGGMMRVDVGADPANAPDPDEGPFAPFNTFMGNSNFGLRIEATSDDVTGVPSIIRGNIIANSFDDQAAFGDGLQLLATGDTTTLAFLDFGSTGGSPAVPVLSADNAPLGAFSGIIDLNTFDRQNSGERGAVVDLLDASGDVTFIRNSFVGGNILGGTGLDMRVAARAMPNGNPTAQLLATVGGPLEADANLFDFNDDAGLSFTGAGFIGIPPAQLDRSFLQVTNNIITNTSGDGIFLRRENTALFTAVIGDGTPLNGGGNLIQGNSSAGIQLTSQNGTDQASSNGNAATFVYMDDNTIDDNGLGFNADLNADTVIQVIGVTNSITNTFSTAVDINTNNNSSFGLPAQPVTGEDLNDDGIIQPWEDIDFDGDPTDTVGPTVLSSVFDSNLVQGFGIDGFWMTATGGSFQDIRISGTQLANPADPESFIRTLVDGDSDGDFPGNFDGIHIDAFGSQAVFMSRPSVWTIQGVDIIGVDNDGILYNSASGTNILNIGGPFTGYNVTVDGAGNDGFAVNAGGAANDFININRFDSINNVADGADIVQTGVNDLFFNMTDSRFLNNGESGFSADNRALGFSSVYNIGTEERNGPNGILDGINEDANDNGLLDPTEYLNGNGILDSGEDVNNDGVLGFVGNEFNGNAHQGFFFQTLSPVTGPSGAIAGNFFSGDATDPPAVANAPDQNFQGVNDAPGGLDTFYTIVDPTTGQLIPELAMYANSATTSVNVQSRLNFYDNQVLSNGTPATQADGMVLSVGTNTLMAATIDNNLFGGNTLDDLHIITVVSQNPLNGAANGGDPDRIERDPVAFLDIAFGENFQFSGNNAPALFADNPSGPGVGNIGESIFVETIGHGTSVVGRTETGLFTNSDNVKPANRNAVGVYSVFVEAGNPADLDATNFFSQQPGAVAAQFLNANVFIPQSTNTNGVLLPVGNFNTVNFVDAIFDTTIP